MEAYRKEYQGFKDRDAVTMVILPRRANVLGSTEVRLMTAIAADCGCNIYKTDTEQAFLYGDLEEDEPIYFKPPDWWFEPVPERHVLQSLKSVYGTVQAAHRWQDNDYRAVNSEKTIFMSVMGKNSLRMGYSRMT